MNIRNLLLIYLCCGIIFHAESIAVQAQDQQNKTSSSKEAWSPLLKSLFEMDAIRDSSTLEIEVLSDWHRVEGPVATRQKLMSIKVGEIWPGQDYRMPVRMIVPADRKAKGFHLTGGNTPSRLKNDRSIFQLEQELIQGGVGLVYTVVQVLEQSGLGEIERVRSSF
ncbi:MAG: hypothetical protein ACKVH8_19520 [Pirellulales bacterium]